MVAINFIIAIAGIILGWILLTETLNCQKNANRRLVNVRDASRYVIMSEVLYPLTSLFTNRHPQNFPAIFS